MEFLADRSTPRGTGGISRIAMEGKTVDEGRAEHTVPGRFSATETLDIGCDLGSPVSDSYQSPSRFTGNIDGVKIQITTEGPSPA